MQKQEMIQKRYNLSLLEISEYTNASNHIYTITIQDISLAKSKAMSQGIHFIKHQCF